VLPDVDATLALALAFGVLIGLALGVFGGGGSILAVPVLVYVTRLSPAAAVSASLAIVGITSLVAAYTRRCRGCLHARVALVFGGAGIVTAFASARVTHLVSGRVLMLAFAALMIAAGAWMLFGRRAAGAPDAAASPPRYVRAVLAGAAVGAVTGFLGVGGGFLAVPALIALTGLDMRAAVATSLLVIAINSAAGFVGHVGDARLDLGLVAALTAAAVAGALAGERMAAYLSVERLRRGFAVFVIAVGLALVVSSAGANVG
jgi:hypothetical protein